MLDIEKLFYVTSRSHEEAEENQIEFGKLGIQKWEEIEMLHQWLLMCTINKFGPPTKGDVDSDEKPDHDIHTFIHCKKCLETKSPPILAHQQHFQELPPNYQSECNAPVLDKSPNSQAA